MTRNVTGAAGHVPAREGGSMTYRIRLATEDDIPGIGAMIPFPPGR